MVPAFRSSTDRAVGRLLSVLAVIAAGAAVTYLLFPNPLSDAFFAGIVALSVVFALVGAIGAWTDRPPLVWAAALSSTGLSIAGLMSIGLLVAPAALLLFGAALFSQRAGPSTDFREAVIADPPTEQELLRKKLVGVGAVIVGVGLTYAGAFARELFGSCARETVACALRTTNWGAVGSTVLGLSAMGYGGWLLWKQAYIERVLASTQTQ